MEWRRKRRYTVGKILRLWRRKRMCMLKHLTAAPTGNDAGVSWTASSGSARTSPPRHGLVPATNDMQ